LLFSLGYLNYIHMGTHLLTMGADGAHFLLGVA
jgi:hypothetical protein